jgi:hypothetical protein
MFTFAAVPAFAQANEAAKKRAEELLSKARAAIGDEAKIKAVKSLSLASKITRSPSAVDMKVEVELDFLFPDKYVKREKNYLQVGTANLISALDGETAWLHRSSSNEMIRFEGFSQKDADDRKPVLRAEAARWILGLLLRTPTWSPLEFPYGSEKAKNTLQVYHRHIETVYAGAGDADGKSADLIDVKGGDGFQARLFLDKTNHRLMMMSYTGKLITSKRKQIKTDEDGNVSESESGSGGSGVAGMKADEVRVRFADYRAVDGIQMPHRVVFQSGEAIKEEWELTKIQVNAPLAPEIFKKKT